MQSRTQTTHSSTILLGNFFTADLANTFEIYYIRDLQFGYANYNNANQLFSIAFTITTERAGDCDKLNKNICDTWQSNCKFFMWKISFLMEKIEFFLQFLNISQQWIIDEKKNVEELSVHLNVAGFIVLYIVNDAHEARLARKSFAFKVVYWFCQPIIKFE